jgi:uncharacterized SAM-binding protein YcdF (DUF218 family)
MAFALLVYAIAHAGRFLVEDDPLQHADAIAVLAGTTMDRPLGAYDLYERGYAPVIILTRDQPEVSVLRLAERGIVIPSKADVERQALLMLDVPAEAIILPDRIHDNTAQEAQTFRAVAMQHGWHRLIVVTSVYHTRRAAFAIRRELKGTGVDVEMHATTYEPLHPDRWWSTREDMREVLDEGAKLIAYELGLGA